MPGHEGAGPGSRCRRCRVPWVGRTCAVAPCLLCEVLAVILVLWSGVAGREGGSAGLGLHPPASVAPDPATRLSGWHTGSPSLLSLNLLFILQVSILSEQMVFCVS